MIAIWSPASIVPIAGGSGRQAAAGLVGPWGMVELIPRTVLFGNPERTSPRLSPDGRRLAWLAPRDGVLNVWVGPLGRGRSPLDAAVAVTGDRERGIRSFIWAHDNRHLMYIQDAGGDENWRVFDVDLDALGLDDHAGPGAEAISRATRDLTPFEGVAAQVIGVDKRHPHDVLIGLNRDNPQLHDVYHLDLRTGALEKVVENPGFVAWVADSELVVRAGMAPQHDGGFVLMVREGQEAPWRAIVAVDADDALTSAPLAFSRDGSSLLAISSVGVDAGQLVRLDLASGATEVIAGDPHADVSSVHLHPDTLEPQFAVLAKDRAEYLVLDPSLEEEMASIRALHPGDPVLASEDDADAKWLMAFTNDAGPIPYFIWDRLGRRGDLLFEHQPRLAEFELASMEPFSFQARDGLEVHGYASFPPGGGRARLPAVVNVHGGPWARDQWGFDPEAQWLANRGYLCVQVNYRGSTGYGKAFVNAGDREWGAKMHEDLLDAVDWVVAQGWADRRRIGIYGGSYGGYAALVGAAFTPEAFCCAVDIVGPSNLKTLIESVPPYWAPLIAQFHRRVGDPATDEQFLWSRSPLSRAGDIRIPLLIAQGANDPRVKQAESEQIVAALTAAGIDHEYLLFPDEGHGFAKPGNRLRFYAAAEAFLGRHLGGRVEP